MVKGKSALVHNAKPSRADASAGLLTSPPPSQGFQNFQPGFPTPIDPCIPKTPKMKLAPNSWKEPPVLLFSYSFTESLSPFAGSADDGVSLENT